MLLTTDPQLPHSIENPSPPYDVIVVGAGAVGIVLAIKLSQAGKRVALIDSGALSSTPNAQALNEGEVVGRPHDGITLGRARVVGGTTTLWGGQLTFFSESDFDTIDEQGNRQWPIDFGCLRHYYREAATFLGLNTSLLDDFAVQARLDIHPPTDDNCEIFFTRWLREPNFAELFSDELANNSNLLLLPSTHATRLLCDAGSGRISGVEVIGPTGRTSEICAPLTILANGTIEISRLLLLSKYADAQVPWASNDNVGAYFQDHIDIPIGHFDKRQVRVLRSMFENALIDGDKYQPKIRLRDTARAQSKMLNVAVSLRFDSHFSDDIALLKILIRSLRAGRRLGELPIRRLMGAMTRLYLLAPLAWRYLRHRRIGAIADAGISIIAHCEQRPLKSSRVRLSSDRCDRFGLPAVVLDWNVDLQHQYRNLRLFTRMLHSYFERSYGITFSETPGSDAGVGFLNTGRDSFHQCGGARMSSSSNTGVVDADCRVHGTTNLYVAGAAVFPSSSFANPTLTAIALSLRLADHLLKADHV